MTKKESAKKGTVGVVKTEYFTFSYPPDYFILSNGSQIGPVTLAYETYGVLNENRSNAILILHALSGSAHAAGFHSEKDKNTGWWDLYIGPGKAFDTEKYFVICSNVLGGCSGSTGPASINPETGRAYGMDFPMVTIADMVNAQKKLIDHLGIKKLLAVAGGSMGGMQALQWTISYPDMVESCIAIATSASLSAQGIAFNEVGRQAIFNDPHWNNGNYYNSRIPKAGLSLARMIGHITYMSEKHMHEKFGRKFQDSHQGKAGVSSEFMVESYLKYQGIKFVERFDANSYIYITRAIDHFDLKEDFGGSLTAAFENVSANYLVISFTSDWLYPSSNSKEIVRALRVNGKNVNYIDIETDNGHDAFLLPNEILEKNIKNFLKSEFKKSEF
ncbi:MAG TPA: homoserine O-acetyltransferase [Spirochaetota bacterium]|jgi:homoserine O-acetyltransferase|nr:homoserine O-acetyltransferase [Spirochaetota bacterium]HOK02102.1 homoserine O-acetyltransferase [Spirochaetota bacterium]HOV09310.1 homoserine O-acetyltransferase [Spirochaetota bacterium]